MMTCRLTPEEFLQYLGEQHAIDVADVPEPCEWSNLGNRLGAIALRLGLLTVDQIDQILEDQEDGGTWRRFGEIAVDRGFLTAEQLDRLCEIQGIHRVLEAGERLVAVGQLDLASLVQSLSEFLRAEINRTASA